LFPFSFKGSWLSDADEVLGRVNVFFADIDATKLTGPIYIKIGLDYAFCVFKSVCFFVKWIGKIVEYGEDKSIAVSSAP